MNKFFSFFQVLLNCIVVVGFSGNVFLVIQIIQTTFKPIMILELALILSDFILIIYYLCIVAVDWKYSGKYIMFDIEWKKSLTCKTLDFIASFSFLTSNLCIMLITYERYLGVTSLTVKNSKNFTKIVLSICLILFISVLLSLMPFLLSEVLYL